MRFCRVRPMVRTSAFHAGDAGFDSRTRLQAATPAVEDIYSARGRDQEMIDGDCSAQGVNGKLRAGHRGKTRHGNPAQAGPSWVRIWPRREHAVAERSRRGRRKARGGAGATCRHRDEPNQFSPMMVRSRRVRSPGHCLAMRAIAGVGHHGTPEQTGIIIEAAAWKDTLDTVQKSSIPHHVDVAGLISGGSMARRVDCEGVDRKQASAGGAHLAAGNWWVLTTWNQIQAASMMVKASA